MMAFKLGDWARRVLALAAIVVWMAWGYIRLRPPAWMVHHGQLAVNAYDSWAFRNLGYSDVVKLYQTRFLFNHLAPYIHNRIEYPVLTGLFMWATALGHGVQGYFFETFVVMTLIAIAVYLIMERIAPKAAFYFAASPLLVLYGLLNWDLLGIGLMVGAWVSYRRQRSILSAILLALGVFAKLFPIFLAPFMLAELLRQRRYGTIGKMVAVFLGASLVVNLPFAIGNLKNWAYFFTYNANRGLSADIYSNAWVQDISTHAANDFSLAVVVLAVLWFMWRVYRGARSIDAAAATFTIFLFVNKVYSPQYTLWVLVFAVLAEWPVWTYGALTLMGILDYLNSFTMLELYTARSSSTMWYANHLFSLGLAYRYLTLLATGVGGWMRRPMTEQLTRRDNSTEPRRLLSSAP
ncbi:glycosyltransferase 87 family protein [Sulfobacillus harzensis]|uniref:DUF2029 domain-containing protein n=1 Tax=Sulfobacillus harzensis TaxID=2729629 RepID=A0A7Y0L8X2_9FIRM|nr:glycosyltransferase 87 family protein [Sulfobacillus harzensis]NMP24069.1 DUF2029 domain-containing protein [Sulfobacillus harzensis]